MLRHVASDDAAGPGETQVRWVVGRQRLLHRWLERPPVRAGPEPGGGQPTDSASEKGEQVLRDEYRVCGMASVDDEEGSGQYEAQRAANIARNQEKMRSN